MASDGTGIIAFPMHGSTKLVKEGFRTRDGHIIEWLSKLVGENTQVDVHSRPEPIALIGKDLRRSRLRSHFPNLEEVNSYSAKIPTIVDRQKWWHRSRHSYSSLKNLDQYAPAIVWNPFIAVSNIGGTVFNGRRTVVFDLLDDWTHHFAFAGMRKEVEAGYRESFAKASFVTANAEGTEALARRFDRSDVFKILNGVDAERFSSTNRAVGPLTIGYVGKIGRRLDLELIQNVARGLPNLTFIFAGPILDSEYRTGLKDIPNIKLVGDVHYSQVPSLLETFDIGWVPHLVGDNEVGGDVIKTYEYRAAGLQVLSTPVAGAGSRGLDGVTVLESGSHLPYLMRICDGRSRIPRLIEPISEEAGWEGKTRQIVSLLTSERAGL